MNHWISADINWENVNHDDGPTCERICCKACRVWLVWEAHRNLYCADCGEWFCSEDCKANVIRHPCARRYHCGHARTESNSYTEGTHTRCKRCHKAWARARKLMMRKEAGRAALVQAARIDAAVRKVRASGRGGAAAAPAADDRGEEDG